MQTTDSVLETVDVGEPLGVVSDKVTSWVDAFIAQLPNLVVALLVLTAGWYVARGVSKLVRKALTRSIPNPDLSRLIGTTTGIVTFLGMGFVALAVLNLDKTVTTLLAGAGIVGVALGFAFQETAANFISGVALAIRRPFREGDLVQLGDELATVEQIDLRTTTVRRLDGPIVHIPNKSVFGNPIVNYSAAGRRRFRLEVGVSYSTDLDRARRVVLDALSGLDCRDPEQDPEFFWQEFGGSSINGIMQVWLDDESMPHFLDARSQAVVAVKRAFDEAGITIPFPIRTLDFGIEGGTEIGDALPWDDLLSTRAASRADAASRNGAGAAATG